MEPTNLLAYFRSIGLTDSQITAIQEWAGSLMAGGPHDPQPDEAPQGSN